MIRRNAARIVAALPGVYCAAMAPLLRLGVVVLLSAAAVRSNVAQDVAAGQSKVAQDVAADSAQASGPGPEKQGVTYADVEPLWDLLRPHLPPALASAAAGARASAFGDW